MHYPNDFPEGLKAPVGIAFVAAEKAFLSGRRERGGPREAAMQFIISVWRVYAHQACEAVRGRLWTAERVQGRIRLVAANLAASVPPTIVPRPIQLDLRRPETRRLQRTTIGSGKPSERESRIRHSGTNISTTLKRRLGLPVEK